MNKIDKGDGIRVMIKVRVFEKFLTYAKCKDSFFEQFTAIKSHVLPPYWYDHPWENWLSDAFNWEASNEDDPYWRERSGLWRHLVRKVEMEYDR